MNHNPQKDCPHTIKESLGEMNSHYQAIRIPENLKSQVEDSIRRAKQDLDFASETQMCLAETGTVDEKQPCSAKADSCADKQHCSVRKDGSTEKQLCSVRKDSSAEKQLCSVRKDSSAEKQYCSVRKDGSAEKQLCSVRKDSSAEKPAHSKKRWRIASWAKLFSASAAAAVLALAILANSSASIAHAMGQVPFLGVIVDIVTFRDYRIYNKNMKANLKIPKTQVTDSSGEALEEATDQLNSQIHRYTTKIIAAYLDDVKASGGEGLESVDLDYDIATDNDKLFSLRFHKTLTMASAEQSEKIYHIDKETGKMATIKDLFQEDSNYREVISQNIKEQMRAQMEEDEEKTYYIADTPAKETEAPAVLEGDGSTTYYIDGTPLTPRWDFGKDFKATPLEDGDADGKAPSNDPPSSENTTEGNAAEDNMAAESTSESGMGKENTDENGMGKENTDENGIAEGDDGFYEISDDVNFYVNESGKLVIVFDEYEVAPGYMGTVSFEIPTDVMDGIVKDGYLK